MPSWLLANSCFRWGWMARNFVAITVKERGATPRRLQKALNQSVTAGLRSVAEWHHTENVPKRFTKEHAREARYVRRSREYESRKRREGRGDSPMVYTGRSRARASVAKITANSKRAKLTYSIPALNFLVGPRGRKRTMRSEFEKVVYTERIAGERVAAREIRQSIRKDNTRTSRRVL